MRGHLEVAAAVAAGHAEAGVTIRVAAEAYGLGFIPLREARYDLAIPETELESAPVKRMLDALNSRRFANEVSQLCATLRAWAKNSRESAVSEAIDRRYAPWQQWFHPSKVLRQERMRQYKDF